MKKAKDYKIEKRGDGRFSVRKRGGGTINGAEKLKILLDAGVVKAPKAKAKVEEAPAEG